MTQTVKRV